MVAVPSTMLSLGTQAPDFRLPDADGKLSRRDDFKDAPALLVAFICNHCPYVKHVREGLAALARDAMAKGVAVVGINPNDSKRYPDDGPEAMKSESAAAGYTFPYLVDASQEIAFAYRAACTPDFFLFDGARRLVYRGQMDDSRPGNDAAVTGRDLRNAIDAVLAGQPVSETQIPSIGCNIKWKPGREPQWFAL